MNQEKKKQTNKFLIRKNPYSVGVFIFKLNTREASNARLVFRITKTQRKGEKLKT